MMKVTTFLPDVTKISNIKILYKVIFSIFNKFLTWMCDNKSYYTNSNMNDQKNIPAIADVLLQRFITLKINQHTKKFKILKYESSFV